MIIIALFNYMFKIMKKILIIALSASFAATVNAQEAEDKTVLAGINFWSGINFTQPQTNKIESSTGSDIGVGIAVDWHFADNFALSTGAGFEFNRFSHKFMDSLYFYYNDKDILQRGNEGDDNFLTNTGEGAFLLDNRTYRLRYINIPTMIRFQTNYMGYLRYFAKAGAIHNIRARVRTDSYGMDLDDSNKTELLDMNTPGDISFYKLTVGFSFGAEWNFAGSTCLYGDLGYYFGVTELHQQDAITGDKTRNNHLFYDPDLAKIDRDYFSPTAQQGQLLLRIGILF
jgi:hypothetical protein